jgi:hypothetical protein
LCPTPIVDTKSHSRIWDSNYDDEHNSNTSIADYNRVPTENTDEKTAHLSHPSYSMINNGRVCDV